MAFLSLTMGSNSTVAGLVGAIGEFGDMTKKLSLVIALLIGGMIGVLLVRLFFLDPLEKLGWSMFWSGLGNGRMMDLGIVLKSNTLAKCAGGFAIAGIASAFAAKFALQVTSRNGPVAREVR
jgi:tetrahydromethanopterin S-methyltransferase subunit C